SPTVSTPVSWLVPARHLLRRCVHLNVPRRLDVPRRPEETHGDRGTPRRPEEIKRGEIIGHQPGRFARHPGLPHTGRYWRRSASRGAGPQLRGCPAELPAEGPVEAGDVAEPRVGRDVDDPEVGACRILEVAPGQLQSHPAYGA